MCSFDELIDDLVTKFEAFAEGNCHYSGADFVGLGSAEVEIVDCSVKRFEFLMASVVADTYDRNLDLVKHWQVYFCCCNDFLKGTDAASVTA
jgi:hypothetical protein